MFSSITQLCDNVILIIIYVIIILWSSVAGRCPRRIVDVHRKHNMDICVSGWACVACCLKVHHNCTEPRHTVNVRERDAHTYAEQCKILSTARLFLLFFLIFFARAHTHNIITKYTVRSISSPYNIDYPDITEICRGPRHQLVLFVISTEIMIYGFYSV